MPIYPEKIFLIGFMGVGKSHWGTRLARALNYPFFDLDEEIVRAENGRSIYELFEEKGEAYFRDRESETLHRFTALDQSFVMACGGGTPCYLNNMERMNAVGLTIWLQSVASELAPRLLSELDKRPLLKNLQADQLMDYIEQKQLERSVYYQQAKRKIQESELSEDHLLKQLLYE